MSPAASWALLAALTLLVLLALRAAARRLAMHEQRLEDRLRAQREERDRFDLARARNHYGVPCATVGCGCADSRRAS